MSGAITTLARTTVLDAIGDTAGSASSLRPGAIDNAAIESLLRRGRRWRIPSRLGEQPVTLVVDSNPAAAGTTRFRRLSGPAMAFFISLAIHLLVLLTASLIAVPANLPLMTTILVDGSMLDAEREEITWEAPIALTTSEARGDVESMAFRAVALDPGTMQAGAPAVELLDPHGIVGPLADRGVVDGNGDGLAASGEGDGGDDVAAGQDGAEFFGVQAAGSRFVFVCDCSGSMAGLKWAELHRELSRSIGGLGPGKAFYAIFFDGEMHPMFEPFHREPALLDATSANVEKARQWIASKSLGANTSPCESMKFAANLEPDAIFLLTDGEFSDYTAPYLRDFNKKRVAAGKPKVVVHTIGFFSEKHQRVLERIAKDSGGTYQFVAGPKPVKEKRKSHNVYARPIGLPAFAGPAPIAPLAPQRGD